MVQQFRRYTDVLSLLELLKSGHLTLLPPNRWFDQNDAIGLRSFGERMGGYEVFAYCMAQGPERSHHWQIFSGHSHGVCILFDQEKLLEQIDAQGRGIIHGAVQYKNLKQLEEMEVISDEMLPYLKRDTFSAEMEYRIIACISRDIAGEVCQIPISLTCIDRVVCGPSMPEGQAKILSGLASDLPGCEHIQFNISRLGNNAKWNKAFSSRISVQ